jgi:hypothetical protein
MSRRLGIPQFGLVAEDMEKVNSDLAVRDKQGRSYAERKLSEDRGYKAAPVSGVQTKVAVQTNGHFASGKFKALDQLTH